MYSHLFDKSGALAYNIFGVRAMYSRFTNSDCSNHDFNVVQYGVRQCVPKFNVYYASCPNYLFHYVYSGCGVLCVKKSGVVTQYDLQKNQAFIIFPGQEVWYCSDENDPFMYAWIEFFGNKVPDLLQSASLSVANPIHTASEPYECGDALMQIVNAGTMSPMRLTAHFWLLADCLAKNADRSSDYQELIFNKALKYIHSNVNRQTTVEDVARHAAVSRGYLAKIFSKYIHQSPKQYITSFHINEAKSLLSGTALSVSEVASKVGYDNTADFTRTFKRITEMTPSEFKKSVKI